MNDRPNKIAFIDTETTGLSHLSRPWEIAVILREDSVPDQANPGPMVLVDTEYVFQVEYTPRTLPDGTDPVALEVGGWRERGQYLSPYREALIDEGVNTAYGPEWSIARSLQHLLDGATLVGVGVHYDAEVLGRMFLRHGLDWHPWHYGIIDLKAAAWGYLRAQQLNSGIPGDSDWDIIPIRSETVASLFVPPVPEAERHTALGDTRWARDWFDVL